MKRGCQKSKPVPQRGRTRQCYFWGASACRPQRTRSRFSPPPRFDPCLGARKPRRERPRRLSDL